jgi:putative SOS response-associated peptidase YedK
LQDQFLVITCEPNAMMAELHNRVPVIIAPAE